MRTSLVLLLALAASAASSHAAIVYSGLQNITIGSTFDSVYVDVDGNSSSSTQGAGWDIDAFFGGQGIGNSDKFQPARQTVAVDSPILRLNAGQTVDSTLSYYTTAAGSSTHIGNGATQFQSGVEGYFGFTIVTNDDSGPYYGWMRVSLSNDGSTGKIIDWAFDNTGSPITVGAVPEVQSAALAGLGCLTLALRRRRK